MTVETKKVLKSALDEMKEYCREIIEPQVTYSRDPLIMANRVIANNAERAKDILGILNMIR